MEVEFIKPHYEVGHKNIDPDTGNFSYTPLALTMTEDNAKLLVFCLQSMDEDPNTEYIYNKVDEIKFN